MIKLLTNGMYIGLTRLYNVYSYVKNGKETRTGRMPDASFDSMNKGRGSRKKKCTSAVAKTI